MADFSQYFSAFHQESLVKTSQFQQTSICTTPKHPDSDQESIETNDSNNEQRQFLTPIKHNFEEQTPEIDVQPKRKIFFSAEQKQKYVEDYQKKYKTEVCKNWIIKGTCPYGSKCCFAHGYHELQTKKHLKSTYKTKPCKKFFVQGFCPYGYRCQYLHSDIKQYPQYKQYLENLFQFKNLPLSLLDSPKQSYQEQLIQIVKEEMISNNFQRLSIFNQLENKQENCTDSMMMKEFPSQKLLMQSL